MKIRYTVLHGMIKYRLNWPQYTRDPCTRSSASLQLLYFPIHLKLAKGLKTVVKPWFLLYTHEVYFQVKFFGNHVTIHILWFSDKPSGSLASSLECTKEKVNQQKKLQVRCTDLVHILLYQDSTSIQIHKAKGSHYFKS